MENKIRNELQKLYHTGDRVTNKELKKQIQLIYDRLGYKAKAKGTDIKLYGKTPNSASAILFRASFSKFTATILIVVPSSLHCIERGQNYPQNSASRNAKKTTFN